MPQAVTSLSLRRDFLHQVAILRGMAVDDLKPRKEIAILPVRSGEGGRPEVMLMASGKAQRLGVLKTSAERGRKDYRVAVFEARQQAGIIGRVHPRPIGSYVHLERIDGHTRRCIVKIYQIETERQASAERAEGRFTWFPADGAADLIDDPGLASIVRQLFARWRTRLGGHPPPDR